MNTFRIMICIGFVKLKKGYSLDIHNTSQIKSNPITQVIYGVESLLSGVKIILSHVTVINFTFQEA